MSEDVQAGDREAIKASEEVQVRNLKSMMEFTNATRKMVLELAARIELLQNKMIAMDQQNDQRRMQLATLQQEFYKRGTTSYSDSEV